MFRHTAEAWEDIAAFYEELIDKHHLDFATGAPTSSSGAPNKADAAPRSERDARRKEDRVMAGNIAKRPDGRWRARYRDERGKERARHFGRRIDAQHWLDEVTATIRDGTWVEPRAGNITFDDFYAEWAPRQLWLPSTRTNADLAVGSVPFGDLPFKAIRRSHIESWVKEVSEKWAPTTVKVRFVIVRSVFRAALADRVIGADPCLGVALPRRRKAEAAMQIPTVEEVGKLLRHADSNRVSTRKGFRA